MGLDSSSSGMKMSFVTSPTARASTRGLMKGIQLAIMLYLEWISVTMAILKVVNGRSVLVFRLRR